MNHTFNIDSSEEESRKNPVFVSIQFIRLITAKNFGDKFGIIIMPEMIDIKE